MPPVYLYTTLYQVGGALLWRSPPMEIIKKSHLSKFAARQVAAAKGPQFKPRAGKKGRSYAHYSTQPAQTKKGGLVNGIGSNTRGIKTA